MNRKNFVKTLLTIVPYFSFKKMGITNNLQKAVDEPLNDTSVISEEASFPLDLFCVENTSLNNGEIGANDIVYLLMSYNEKDFPILLEKCINKAEERGEISNGKLLVTFSTMKYKVGKENEI